jgi:hypothetical protein
MKRIPEVDPRGALDPQPAFTTTTELDGLIRAGMKKEALALVRRLLNEPSVATPTFAEAAMAILSLVGRADRWRAQMESAYERMPKRQRRAARFWLLSIRHGCLDHEAVLRLLPRRFTGKFASLELAWALEAAFATNNEPLLRALAPRLPRVLRRASHPTAKSQLWLGLARCCLLEGRWDHAIAAAKLAQEDTCSLPQAVSILVALHVARALGAVNLGLERIQEYRKNFNPEAELVSPGVQDVLLDAAAKEFGRLQRRLDSVAPKLG